MKTKILALPGLFFCLTLAVSCSKKSSSSSGAHSCRLQTITDYRGSNDTLIYTLTYNGDGSVATLTGSGDIDYVKSFDYVSSTEVLVRYALDSAVFAIDTVRLNGDGFMLSSHEYDAQTGTTETTQYIYGSDDQLQQTINKLPNVDTATSITYTFTNGNLTSERSGGQTSYTFTYDTLPTQTGDFYQVEMLLDHGFPYIKNKNLLKDVAGRQCAYTFDPEGKITSLTVTEGTRVTDTYYYQYSCQ